jgi:hypothetical protein
MAINPADIICYRQRNICTNVTGENMSYENQSEGYSEQKNTSAPLKLADEEQKNMLYALGLLQNKEEERKKLYTPFPSTPFGMPLTPSLDSRVGYGRPMLGGRGAYMPAMPPASQMQRAQYGPAMMPQGMPGQQGEGVSQINIQYTAPDGTQYQMGVTTPQEGRNYALGNMLFGLYALMTAEGKGHAQGGGKAGKAYGGGGNYAAAGGKGGGGGK